MSGDTPLTTRLLNWSNDPSNPIYWNHFADRYRAKIQEWCILNNLSEADAEDVSQNIIILVRNKIHTYDNQKGRFRVWLKSITRNACMDVFRDAKRWSYLAPGWDGRVEQELGRELDDFMRTEILRAAVEHARTQASSRDFQVFYGITFLGRKPSEIANDFELKPDQISRIKYLVMKMVKEKAL